MVITMDMEGMRNGIGEIVGKTIGQFHEKRSKIVNPQISDFDES